MNITNRQFLQRSSVSKPAPHRGIRRARQNQPYACLQDMTITAHGKRRVRTAQDRRTARRTGVKQGPNPDHQHGRKESEGERDEDTQQRGKRSSRKGATSEKTERQRTTRTTLPALRRPCRRDRPPHCSSRRTGSGSGERSHACPCTCTSQG
jgi:hypothetical protein